MIADSNKANFCDRHNLKAIEPGACRKGCIYKPASPHPLVVSAIGAVIFFMGSSLNGAIAMIIGGLVVAYSIWGHAGHWLLGPD